ncbi:hypothetical protein [Dietzia sp. 179-F 9C3 NHS]|uniref:hypothetical protein n=1 Tax=Dietzia sp. 179-F 9C3 NHS TaxID=3374295 RepID=UPI00387A8107
MNDDADHTTGPGDDASLYHAACDPADLDATEAALAALGAGGHPGDADDPLLALLADWRAETAAAPLPALPSDEEIAAALSPNVVPLRGWARRREHHHGQRPALWQAVTGAAAVAAIIVGGLSVAAHSAMPGDPLWGVSKTMFSDRAGDVELVATLSEHLAEADAAAREGDTDRAKRLLGEVSERLGEVSDAAERVELMKRRDAISRDLSRVVPTTVPSPEPRPADPASPGPGAATLVPAPAMPLPDTGLPVIPVPLDGLRISTTLQIPVDPQRLRDLIPPQQSQEPRPEQDLQQLHQAPAPETQAPVTSVPTSPVQPTAPADLTAKESEAAPRSPSAGG